MIRLPVAPDRWSLDYQRQINAAIEQAINDLYASSDQRLVTQQHEASKATKSRRVTPSAGIITIDARLSNVFNVTLDQDAELQFPDGMLDGQVINIKIKQDATGGWALTFAAGYTFINQTAPTPSTAANAIDLMSMQYDEESDTLLVSYLTDFG